LYQEDTAIKPQMMDRIEELLEQVILETFLKVLFNLSEMKINSPPPVCFKSNCSAREYNPF